MKSRMLPSMSKRDSLIFIKRIQKKNPKTSTPIFLGLLNKGAQSKPFVKKKTVLMCLKSAEALKQPSTSLHHKKAHGVSFHPVLSPQSASAVESSSVSHNLGKIYVRCSHFGIKSRKSQLPMQVV